MMINNFTCILCLLFLGACTSSNDAIIEIASGQSVVGFDSDALVVIGKTIGSDIPNPETWEEKGLRFQLDPKGIVKKVSFDNDRFGTQNGLIVGDSLSKAKRLYGEPLKRGLNMVKGDRAIEEG